MEGGAETRETQLAAVDQDTLTPLVQRALNSGTFKVADWTFEPLHGGIGEGTAIYRFSGEGDDQGQTIPWSLILKILPPEGGSADPAAWDYYKREAAAYRSGWLDDPQGGMAAPQCYGVLDQEDGTCWLWLEDIQDMYGDQWPLEHYAVVARHLGRFNGAYLVDRPLPDWPWLSSNWLRRYVEQSAPAIEPLRDALTSPWGRRWLPEGDREPFFRLWAERGLYLDALDRLPQTICHLDVFRRNLFARQTADGHNETVLIDWAFVGRGPVGADLNPLVWMSLAFGGVGLDRQQELQEVVIEGYLQGLRDVGWLGDAQLVRLGYSAACVRYVFPELERWLALILDESLHAGMEQRSCMSIEEAFDSVAWTRRRLFGALDEAGELIASSG